MTLFFFSLSSTPPTLSFGKSGSFEVDFNPPPPPLLRHDESIFGHLFNQKLLCLRYTRNVDRVEHSILNINRVCVLNDCVYNSRNFSLHTDLHHIHTADGQPTSIKSEAMTFNNNMMTMDYQSIQQLASMMPSAPLLNPIDRLYSMQNQYFCTETAQNMQTHHQMCE